MGHSQIGTLPVTRRWKEVVRLIADGANVEAVAEATLLAAERALASVREDAGFREAAKLLVEIGLAAGSDNPREALAGLGIPLSEETTVAGLAVAVGEVLDRRCEALRRPSDFGEMAGRALVAAMIEGVRGHEATFFPRAGKEVGAVFVKVGREKGFGEMARSFFGRLTGDCLDYFLSKTLGTKLGEGQRFATNNQLAEFMGAMRTHCAEASGITEKYAGQWFSKHRHEEGGKISGESAEGFGWYAMEKMRLELEVRAKKS